MSYADFEREKLDRLDAEMGHVGLSGNNGYFLHVDEATYFSDDLIGYCGCKYKADTEFSRLLKRAEFVKAVCEKEGVDWLPKEELPEPGYALRTCTKCWCKPCECKCHNPKETGERRLYGEKTGKTWEDAECKQCQDYPQASRVCTECGGKLKEPEAKGKCEGGYLLPPNLPDPEEREFRRALLDVIEKEVLSAMKVRGENIGLGSIEGLRKRFT